MTWARILTLTLLANAVVMEGLVGSMMISSSSSPIRSPGTPIGDSSGTQWNVQNNGMLYRDPRGAFNNSAGIEVNGQGIGFQPQPPQGKDDFSFSGMLQSVRVERHIKVHDKEGFIRYLETFHNTGPQDITLSVTLNVYLRRTSQGFRSNSGTPSPTLLGKKDSVLILDQGSFNLPSIYWGLAHPGSKVKPVVSNNNNEQYMAQYSLMVKAGQKMSIVHTLALRSNLAPQSSEEKKLCSDLTSPRLIQSMAKEHQKDIVNLAKGLSSEGLKATQLESLQPERGPSDILSMSDGTLLRGNATLESFVIDTAWGEKRLRLEQLAGIVSDDNFPGRHLYILRDGQMISGRITVEKADTPPLTFRMNSGILITLPLGRIQRLLLKLEPEDGQPQRSAGPYVQMRDGSLLALKATSSLVFPIMTPWGPLNIPGTDLKHLQEDDGFDFPVLRMTMKNGSSFPFYWNMETMQADSLEFGSIQLSSSQLVSLFSPESSSRPSGDSPGEGVLSAPTPADQRFNIRLRHQGLITLAPREEEFIFDLEGQRLGLPTGQVKFLERLEETDALSGRIRCTATLWEGDTVSGQLQQTHLHFETASGVLRVEAQDLIEFQTKSPSISDHLREKISSWIDQLGNEDWATREAASHSLAQTGVVARTLLEEAERHSSDTEIRHRARKLLNDMD